MGAMSVQGGKPAFGGYKAGDLTKHRSGAGCKRAARTDSRVCLLPVAPYLCNTAPEFAG